MARSAVVVDLEPLRRWSTPRRRWSPTRRSPGSTWRSRATGPARWMRRPTPASAAAATTRSTPSSSPTNVTGRYRYRDGDVRPASLAAAAVTRGPVRDAVDPPGLPRAAGLHGLARRGRLARHRDGDAVAVRRSRNEVAKALGWPQRRVRAVATPLGGAFGGKWSLFDTLVAAAAVKLGRPVRLVATRSRGLRGDEPGPAVRRRRSGSARTPRAGSRRSRRGSSPTPARSTRAPRSRSPACWSPGRTPGRRSTSSAYGVRTNRVRRRGVPGARGAADGVRDRDACIDELAAELGLDPIELRRRNLAAEGAPIVDGEAWVAHRRGRGPRRARGQPTGGARRERRRGRGRRRRRSATGRARRTRRGGLPDVARRERPGHDRRRRHVGRRRRLPGDRRGVARRSRRPASQIVSARLVRRAGLAGQRRQHDHLLGGPGDPGGGRGRRPSRLLEAAALAARDRRGRPGARRRHGPAARHAGAGHPDRQGRARQRPGRSGADRGATPGRGAGPRRRRSPGHVVARAGGPRDGRRHGRSRTTSSRTSGAC